MQYTTIKNSAPTYFYIFNLLLFLFFYCPLLNASFIAWDNENDQWLTQSSDHFSISYLSIHQADAERILQIAEEVHRELIPFFENSPEERTDIILYDDSDYALPGFSALEQGEIRLLMTPPTEVIDIAERESWIYIYLSNEYSNILHFNLAKGTLRGLFLSPEFTPSFLIEGLSLYLTSYSQLQSKYLGSSKFAMKMRMEVAADEFMQLQQVILSNKQWPLESIYLYGAYFIHYLATTYGEDKVFDFLENYNQNLLSYLSLNTETEKVFDKDFLTLWDEFQVYLTIKFSTQINLLKENQVNGDLLLSTPFIQVTANHQDGLLSSYVNGEDRHQIINYKEQDWQQITPTHKLVAMDSHPTSGIAITRNIAYLDGRKLNDIFIYNENEWTRLSERQRYKYIRWMPNGKQLLASRNISGISELWLINTDKNVTPLLVWKGEVSEVLGNFDISQDGEYLVAAIKHPLDYWKLARFNLKEKTWQPITQLQGSESSPRFLNDGRIIYSANYTGVYNIFVLDEKTQKIQQLTNVIGGAFQPSWQPDLGLVFQTYGSENYMLRKIEFPEVLHEFPISSDATLTQIPQPAVPEIEISPPSPYSSWSTFKPHSWIPALRVDEVRNLIGVNTYGGDALGRHNYDAYFMWDAHNKLASYLFKYTYDNRWVVEYLRDYKYKNLTPNLGTNYQITRNQTYLIERNNMFSTWEEKLSFHSGLSLRQDDIISNSGLDLPFFNPDLSIEAIEINGGLAVTYDNREYYLNVNKVGWGHYLDFTYHQNLFGGDFDGSKLQTQWRGTWDLPRRFTILTRLASGYSTPNAKEFSIGGSNFREEMNLFDRTSQSLRGYDDVASRGHYYFTQRVEFNASIAHFSHNLGLLPIGLGDLDSTLFVDSGSAWSDSDDFEQLTGVGAEITLYFKLGYNYSLPITLGYANGLDDRKGREYLYMNFGVAY